MATEYSREQVQGALEAARADENEDAIAALEDRLSQMPEDSEPTSVESAALEQRAPEEPTGGLRSGGLGALASLGQGGTASSAPTPETDAQEDDAGRNLAALKDFASGTAGALGYGAGRGAGAALENIESDYDRIQSFQTFLVNDALPPAERERVAKRAREKYGEDSKYTKDPSLLPSSELKSILEENPDNEELYDSIAGDEWWSERKEFVKRGLAKIGSAWTHGKVLPGMGFGADNPEGALTGRGAYEGIEYEDGEAPAYPAASVDLRDWMDRAESGPSVYEALVMPITEAVSGRKPGELISEGAEKIKDNLYTKEQLEGSKKFILNPDVEITGFSSFVEALEGSRLADPMQAYLMFMENAPELGLSFAVTRGAGGVAARIATADRAGDTLKTVNKARELAAGRAGMVAGGATEGIIVSTHVEKETRDILEKIPMETYRESETFQQMTEAGMTDEAAKQILSQQAASQAGTTAAVVTMLTGSPLNTMMGRSAAGRLVQKNKGLRRATMGVGEPLTEGIQEVLEMLTTESAVRPIDPDNPIFADPNRYLSAGLAGAAIAAPFGLAGAMEPSTPVGISKEDTDAVRKAAEFAEATNERFKFETKISSPEYIENTAPIKRLEALEKLESLQEKEANAILDGQDDMRAYIERQGGLTAKTELKMLSRLVMRARAMKADIDVARSKRTTAFQIQEAEKQILAERAEIQRRVENRSMKLEDLESQAQAIELIQQQGDIEPDQERELIRDGYAKRVGEEQRLIVTPKGRRSVKQLRREARNLRSSMEAGYTGKERRQTENLTKRQLVDEMPQESREQMLYTDVGTDIANRRAFNERQENIDVKAGETKREVANAAPVVAAVDVDSLAWVNDNMSHAAGDRLLVSVAEAISAQPDVEVYRLGGDEFAVTGQTEEAVEAAMQAAAKQLQGSPIVADNDEVTPTITWGKGQTYDEADAESVQRKQERIQRGTVAGRKERPAGYRVRSQQGLFQMDQDQVLSKSWFQVANQVKRGDLVELLTPEGATFATVTKVSNKRGRPRLEVVADGRRFKMNPLRNWLIIDERTDAADLAWLTGDEEFTSDDRDTLPQTLSDVMIGHIGNDDGWYADLDQDFDYEVPEPWYMRQGWKPRPMDFIREPPTATAEDVVRAEAVISSMMSARGFNERTTPITIVKSVADLEKTSPEIVSQIRAELNGGSIDGVRGYMDHINPNNGVFIFVPNIRNRVGDEMFEQGVMETVVHELVGHYGVRGFFGNEAELRTYMNDIVDSFPRLSQNLAVRLGLNKSIPEQKQLLGEEMIAYIAGEVESGKVKFTKEQKGLWQRFLDYIKDLLIRRKLDRFAPVKKMVSIDETKEVFWNDARVQDLLTRSADFIRSGKKVEWAALGGIRPYMRDGDMFKSGILNAIDTAVLTVSKGQRKNEAKQRGVDIDQIPAEQPMFPETGSPNAYMQSIQKAQNQNAFSALEAKLTGLTKDSEWNFFDEATYGHLAGLHAEFVNNGNKDPFWYRDVLPPQLSQELDAIYKAMEDAYMVGPLPQYGDEKYRPVLNETSLQAQRSRIEEIMSMKMDNKKTTLTKDLLRAHLQSAKSFRVTVEPEGGFQPISDATAAHRLFGPDQLISDLTEDQWKKVKAEVERSKARGYQIGYDKEQDRWFDYVYSGAQYSTLSPQGAKYNRDYRVVLIKTYGQTGVVAREGQHFDPNIMHIRTSEAKLLEYEGMMEIISPNPEKQGMALGLIELQSDQFQKNRTGFASTTDRVQASEEVRDIQQMLKGQNLAFTGAVTSDIRGAMEQMLKPLLNLPSDPDTGTRGSLFGNLQYEARQRYPDVLGEDGRWEDLTAAQRQTVWSAVTTSEIAKIKLNLSDAVNRLVNYRQERIKPLKETGGTLDARTFQRLDAIIAERFIIALTDDVSGLYKMVEAMEQKQSQKELVDFYNFTVKDLTGELTRIARTGGVEATRLTMTDYLLKPAMEIVYERMNADVTSIDGVFDQLKKRDVATARIPVSVLDDLRTAMGMSNENINPVQLMRLITNDSQFADVGLQPDDYSISFNEAGKFLDMNIAASKGDIAALTEKLPIMIRKFANDKAPATRQLHLEEQLRRARAASGQGDRDSGYDYSDLVDMFSLELESTEGESTSTLQDYGVQSFYEYEENERQEIEDEILEDEFLSVDWDTVEDGNLSRNSDDYRERLEIDDDGNIDNDDAEQWLSEQRLEYKWNDLREEITEQVDAKVYEKWTEAGPSALITGSLPTEWDEDGDPVDYVPIVIIAKEAGDPYDIFIDGEEIDYASELNEAQDLLDSAIVKYYDEADEEYQPPTGAPYARVTQESPEAPAIQAALDSPQPPWETLASNLNDSVQVISDDRIDTAEKFERMVTLQKKIDSRAISPDHPLSKDETWRPIALKYLLSAAVSRGYGAIVWNNGLATTTRGGGLGLRGTKKLERFTWQKQVINVRGENQDMYVIASPQLDKPIVVSPDKMVPVLGLDATRQINMQEAGKIPVPTVNPDNEVRKESAEIPLEEDYIFSTTGEITAVYRRSNNALVGIANNEAQRDSLVERDMETQRARRNRQGRAAQNMGESIDLVDPALATSPGSTVPQIGASIANADNAIIEGMVRSEDVGDALYIITGEDPHGYEHTYKIPMLAGARQSYEEMTLRIWNKELKKFGARIEETYVIAANPTKAYDEEGQPGMILNDRDAQIAERHGFLEVQELTGAHHGWIVVSQKRGVIGDDVHQSRDYAERYLTEYIANNFGTEKRGVKTFVIRMNDKIREEFSGPVAPFHYDPAEDSALDEMREKIGRKTSKKNWRQRYAEMKQAARHTSMQGGLDRFYGLKKALIQTGQSDGSYIDARLSTSLDSMLRAAVEFGYPVWSDGVVENRGKGLGEILAPIMDDPDTWGLFMAGRRGKRLLMEGYDKLPEHQRQRVDAAAKTLAEVTGHGKTGREAAWKLMVAHTRDGLDQSFEVKPDMLTSQEKSSLSDIEQEYWDTGFLDHVKRKNTKVKNPPRDGRWQVFDWRKVISGNPQENIDLKYEAGTRWLKSKGVKTTSEAHAIMDKLTNLALKKQAKLDNQRDTMADASKSAEAVRTLGRERTFKAHSMDAATKLGDKFPHFQRVADEYAEFNSKMLDFAEEAGMIDKESRAAWEHADYVPFYRVEDDRLSGSFAPTLGISNQKAPIKRLRGKEDAGIGDIVTNIFINTTKLLDGAVKNNAALNAVDALDGTGMLKKVGMGAKQALIPKTEMKKVLRDYGINPINVPDEAFQGIQKMMAIEPPSGDGYISVMRNGKREYYFTDDQLLYRSMSAINMERFGDWIKVFRGPKRLLTEWITIDPGFVIANVLRDTGSAFVVGRDFVPPIIGAVDGFGKALFDSEEMRTLLGAGAAFENGYTTGGDPDATARLLRRYAKDKNFASTVLDSPAKLYRAWRHITTASENANRIAVYKAALAAGKSKKRAIFEAKDLMDFSMGGDWTVQQFLIQSVPFYNARLQGNYRLAKGMVENPVAFTMKGMMVGMAGWVLYMGFREDERYKQLEIYDKAAYYHWWIGDEHYRLPKPFEVGAIFNTIPEMMTEAYLSDAEDSEKELMKGFAHMFGQTFSMNPIPQTIMPIVESAANYNFFTGRPIVSFFEAQRLPPDQYRYRTSPTMRELARSLPKGLDTKAGEVRSPLHLENLYHGYTGTLGRYMLTAADSLVRMQKDYPLPPAYEDADWPVWGRFIRGDSPARRTKQETEVYDLLNKVNGTQASLSFAQKVGDVKRYEQIIEEEMPYIAIAKPLERVRKNVGDINTAIMQIYLDKKMDPQLKTDQINELEKARNRLFEVGYQLRPGGPNNPMEVTEDDIIGLINEFNKDDYVEAAPQTANLIGMITEKMDYRNLAALARAGGDEDD